MELKSTSKRHKMAYKHLVAGKGSGKLKFLDRNDEFLSRYIKDIQKYTKKRITEEEEIRLLNTYRLGGKDSDKALNDLVGYHQPFILMQAKKRCVNRTTMMDLICEGNLGLMVALSCYDERSNAKIITHASYWIKKYMNHFVETSGMVQNSNQSRTFIKLNRIKDDFFKKNGYYASDDTLIDLLKAEGVEIVNKTDLDSITISSLDVDPSDNDDGKSNEQFEIGEIDENIGKSIDDAIRNKAVYDFLQTLSELDRNVIMMMFGFDGNPRTEESIAYELGISVYRVRSTFKRVKNEMMKHKQLFE